MGSAPSLHLFYSVDSIPNFRSNFYLVSFFLLFLTLILNLLLLLSFQPSFLRLIFSLYFSLFTRCRRPVAYNGEAAWRRRGVHYRSLEPRTVNFPQKVIRSYTPACAKPHVICRPSIHIVNFQRINNQKHKPFSH